MRVLVIIAIAFFIFSCEKKELPVKKYDRGDLITTQVDMGSDYRRQVWFSLNDNKIVSVNLKSAWDLAFEASADGYHVLLNGAKAVKIYKTAFTSLAQVTDTAGIGINGKADMPSGNLDSTAIGDWKSDNKVYIINRGYNESGFQQGFYKLKISAVTATQFVFDYGDIYGSEIFHGIVTKDPAYSFIMFSLTDNQQKQIEPKRSEFDFCFTQYTHLFISPLQYYQVTGVVTDLGTRVFSIKDKPFNDIVISDTLGRTVNEAKNAIGYDWKEFNLDNNVYTVNPKFCYVIRDKKGFYYKLHFIDFVNTAKEKGFPKFEFKKL